MMDYQERVVAEKRGLDANLGRLEIFIQSRNCADLPDDEQERLRVQRFHMMKYSEVLGERIAAF